MVKKREFAGIACDCCGELYESICDGVSYYMDEDFTREEADSDDWITGVDGKYRTLRTPHPVLERRLKDGQELDFCPKCARFGDEDRDESIDDVFLTEKGLSELNKEENTK